MDKKEIEKVRKFDCIGDAEEYILKHCHEAKVVSMYHGHDIAIECKLTEGLEKTLCPVVYGKKCFKNLTEKEKKRLKKEERRGGEDYPVQPPYFCADGRMH